tara:strand:+ start:3854 stop:6031 length:2178 start_codon:yes stop_codon:yes gene_type:complete
MEKINALVKKIVINLALACFAFLFLVGCSNEQGGNSNFTQDLYLYPDLDAAGDTEDGSEDDTPQDTTPEIEDTYSIWTDPCVDCAWYFCGSLDVIYQKQICINNCNIPSTVVYEGECEEHLECNPAQHILEANIPCITPEGYPGVKEKICNKGQIQYTNCASECSEEVCDNIDNDCDGDIDEDVLNACGECGDLPEEICDFIDNNCDGQIDEGVANACGGCGKTPEEVCDGIDNDCDGEVDEGQTNACGKCGPLDDEICDGIDNDCDGFIDEDLIDKCSTDCEENLQYCVGGQWICTAKQPLEEVCNGLDDDCDGKADEGLDCLCTQQDIGTLFKCQESPLICGAGYKTCECVDPNDPTCAELQLTECLAVCHWLPQTLSPGTTCDKYLGEIKPEECNNHDDNCNQLTDENLFAGCYSGPPQTMYVGICLPGEMTCLAGTWGNYDDNNQFVKKLCLDEVPPGPEDLCNGTDSNCDGKIDEDKELEPTDILFVVDLSGSMVEEINAVMTALNKFAAHYSDSDVVKWGLVFTASYVPNAWKENVVLQTDLVDFDTFMSIFINSGYSLNGGSEQNYDAIYLAIHNLIGAGGVPYPLADLTWNSSWTTESVPPKEQWNISWREDAKHVIIIFSDEEGQTYLTPSITENILVNMINLADELAVYAFTHHWLIDLGSPNNYEALANAGMGGKVYPLTMKAIEMYNNLLEILDETACGNKAPKPTPTPPPAP